MPKRIPGTNRKTIPGGRARMPQAQRVAEGRARVSDHWMQVRDSQGRFGPASFTWIGLENIDANLLNLKTQIPGNMARALEELKDEMVAYMQSNAPWDDRTGNARAGLQGVVIKNSETSYSILLGHGSEIYYGVYLEFGLGGRYAIVMPTVEHFAPSIGARIFSP